jgi:nucleoside-diphosphate-sugar epimerase
MHVVLGAGALGRATAAALHSAGHRTTIVSRSGVVAQAPEGVTVAAGDIRSRSAMAAALAGAAAIYFCAQPPYHRWPQEFPSLHESAIDVAAQVGARLVVAENLYGYGAVDRAMTEDLPLQPNTRKGRVRTLMHQSLMRAHQDGRVEVAVARGSDFFGPFVDGSAVGARLFQAVIAGKAALYTGAPDARHSYTFVEDFGAALARLGTEPRAAGQVWHVPNAPAVSTRQFLDLAFKLAERRAVVRRFGAMEMQMVGMFIPAVQEMIEMQYEFEAPFVVDHSKFAGAFGDISTPLEAALARTIEWTKARHGAVERGA